MDQHQPHGRFNQAQHDYYKQKCKTKMAAETSVERRATVFLEDHIENIEHIRHELAGSVSATVLAQVDDAIESLKAGVSEIAAGIAHGV